jgi:hypothetical protein
MRSDSSNLSKKQEDILNTTATHNAPVIIGHKGVLIVSVKVSTPTNFLFAMR